MHKTVYISDSFLGLREDELLDSQVGNILHLQNCFIRILFQFSFLPAMCESCHFISSPLELNIFMFKSLLILFPMEVQSFFFFLNYKHFSSFRILWIFIIGHTFKNKIYIILFYARSFKRLCSQSHWFFPLWLLLLKESFIQTAEEYSVFNSLMFSIFHFFEILSVSVIFMNYILGAFKIIFFIKFETGLY